MKKKILVADDEPDARMLIKVALESEGYEVVTAVDGHEALQFVYSHQPDLVILDIVMPKMSGAQLTKVLKRRKSTVTIPIIMVTALDDKKYMRTALWEYGVDFYITKPFDPEDLLDKVRQAFDRPKYSR